MQTRSSQSVMVLERFEFKFVYAVDVNRKPSIEKATVPMLYDSVLSAACNVGRWCNAKLQILKLPLDFGCEICFFRQDFVLASSRPCFFEFLSF